jgi:outer membrane protein TolC
MAVGVPLTGLGEARFVWGGLEEFPPMDDAFVRRLQAAGLLNRLDIRRSLSEYAAAEAALHLEIAKQYPDVHFTPGYLFDQAENKIQFGLSLALPVLNQNGGAIGEAAARRAETGEKFLGLQAQVIGETQSAVTRYQSALDELEQAEYEIRLIGRQLEAGKKAMEIGEQDRLTVAGLEVQYEVAQRLRLDAVRKAQVARSAIEDAIERPLPVGGPTTRPDTRASAGGKDLTQ